VTPSAAAIAVWLAQVLTVALALLLARRRPHHRPFAVWASVVLVADLARQGIMQACPWIIAAGPFAGARRAVAHLDQALWLTEPVGLAAVCWIVFLARRPTAPLLAGVALWCALAIGYPWPFRGAVLGYAYAAIQALSILACFATMAVWTRRRAEAPRPEHACASLATLLTCALFAGPYAPPLPAPFADWSGAELIYLCIWAALAVVHAAALWGGFGMPTRAMV
jgi:hypothetical protein